MLESDDSQGRFPKQTAINRYIYRVTFSLARKILPLLSLVGFLISCKEVEPVVQEIRETPGDIQVLNSSGIPGAASKMRDYLRSQGFDVLEMSNERLWNYEETIIALRNPHWAGSEALAKALHTENVIPLRNKRVLFDATVYVGKDFEKIIQAGSK